MRIIRSIRNGVASLDAAQGIIGVGLVGAGAYLQFGLGWSLLIIGIFFLAAQWGRS